MIAASSDPNIATVIYTYIAIHIFIYYRCYKKYKGMYIAQLLGVDDISTESEVLASVSVSTISTTPGIMFNTTLTDPKADSNLFQLYSNIITFTFDILFYRFENIPIVILKYFRLF